MNSQPNTYLFVERKNGKSGVIDEKGRIIVSFVFDDIRLFNYNPQYGYWNPNNIMIGLKYNGKWGIVKLRDIYPIKWG